MVLRFIIVIELLFVLGWLSDIGRALDARNAALGIAAPHIFTDK